jgi:hypothetical protein
VLILSFKPAAVDYSNACQTKLVPPASSLAQNEKSTVGVDVFIQWNKGSADELGPAISNLGKRLLVFSAL